MASAPTSSASSTKVYVSVSVEPCNSEETRKYWAERAARAKAGLANPSALVNRASGGEFDQGLVNAILAGKGELIATTVDGVRQDTSVSAMSGANDAAGDDTVIHHDVSDYNTTGDLSNPAHTCQATEPFPLMQSVSTGSVLRSSDPFVDKHTTTRRASSQRTQYRLPLDNNVGPYQPGSSSSYPPATSSSNDHDIFVGGEPGPDVGHRYRGNSRVSRPSTPTTSAPDDGSHNVHPAGASRPSFSICTVSRSGSRSQTVVNSRRPSGVRHKDSATSLRSKFSSRKFSTDDDNDQDCPIVVTNALHHILYDGPCRHCETNHCACLMPDSPGLPSTDAPSNNKSRIATEGFCRHCVLNRCSCVVEDPRWGLHHASSTLHQAQQQKQKQEQEQEQANKEQTNTEQEGTSAHASLRIISDTGTVRHYATGHDGSPSSSSNGSEGQMATTTAATTTTATAPTTPPPAYRAPFNRAGNNNDNNRTAYSNVHPGDDIEAQQQREPRSERFIRAWRIRYQSHSHTHSRADIQPAPTTRNLAVRFYWCLVASVAGILIIVGAWYYSNHSGYAPTTG
ncbi:hypothetical protein PG997_004795 [Apiospora hydei]|uniref:Uncharacterized protein n=1 Tax=Apiospora hydei TaxID=1337664 RepID=A0ABR1X382_9PEZI